MTSSSVPEPSAPVPGAPDRGDHGSEVALRTLGPADVGRLVELERELFGRSAWSAGMLREELSAPGRWYVGVDEPVPAPAAQPASAAPGLPGTPGATGDPRLVAYAGLWFDGDVAQVMTIGVALAAQRRGLGAALLTALVGRSRELGAEAVLLEVRVDNHPAVALYERFGFEVLARRKRYYQPEDVDAWTMRLALR